MRRARAASQYLDHGLRLGGVLRTQREQAGLSREDVARRSSVSIETIAKIENGSTVEPGIFTLHALAVTLGCTLDTLMTAIQSKPRPLTPLRFTAARGVLSIGYEGRTCQELISELANRRVAWLIDVRLTPISRKAGLSKRSLRDSLAEAGIEYRHLPALGNPKDNREGFLDMSDRGPRRTYAQRLHTPEAEDALNALTALSASDLVAVLCFERDERVCHREVLLDWLKRTNPDTPWQRA